MNTTIRAVIFDFGGVLVRTGDPVGRRAWETKLGLATGDLERIVHGSQIWINAQHGLMTPDDYWAEVGRVLGIAESDLPQLKLDYFKDDHLDPDLIALIDSLRQAGYKLGLLSNDAVTLEHKLRHEFAIYDHFDAVIISAYIGVMKPDPAAYQAIAQALNVDLQESVFIDDNPDNIEGARKVGMQAIHYRAGMDLQAALQVILKGNL
jgi:putative hydrolase of the HAD superfamily